MKNLLFAAILLASAGVQADITCDEYLEFVSDSGAQVDRVWMIMEEKKRLYMSTTKRHRPHKYEERKKSYERYAIIYNNAAIVHNQQVKLFRENCK